MSRQQGGPATPFVAEPVEIGIDPVATIEGSTFYDPMGGGSEALALSAEGSLVASGGYDGVLRLFDVHTGRSLAAWHEHVESITVVRFVGERLVVTGDGEGDILLWDLSPGRASAVTPVRLPVHHNSPIVSVAVDDDLTWMLSADSRGNAAIWDLTTMAPPRQLYGEEMTGDGVVVSEGDKTRFVAGPGGELAAVHHGSTGFAVWTREAWKVRSSARWTWREQPSVAQMTFLEGGSVLRVLHRIPERMYDDSPLCVAVVTDWSTADGSFIERRSFTVGDTFVYALSPDGLRLAVQDYDVGLRMFDVETQQELDVPTVYGEEEGPERLAFSADGRFLVLGGEDVPFNVLDLASMTLARDTRGRRIVEVQRAALSSGGLAALAVDGRLVFWEPSTDAPLQSFALMPDEMVFVDRDRRLAALGDSVWVMELDTHELLFERLDQLGYVMGNTLDATPDGETVVHAGYDGDITVLDGSSGEARNRIETGHGEIYELLLSPDGRSVVYDGYGDTLRFRELATGKLTREVELEDLSEIIGWAKDRVVVVEGETLRWLHPASGDAKEVARGVSWGAAVLSGDGRFVAWGDPRGAVGLLDLGANRQSLLHSSAIPVSTVALDPGGEHLLVARYDGSVELWRTAELMSLATEVDRASSEDAEVTLPPGKGRAGTDAYGGQLPPHAVARLGRWVDASGARVEEDPAPVEALVFDTTGGLWITADQAGQVRAWTAEGRSLREWTRESGYPRVAALGSGDLLVVAEGLSVMTADGKTTREFREYSDLYSLSVAADGRLAAGTTGYEVEVVDLQSGETAQEIEGHPGYTDACALSPDGSQVATGGTDGMVRVWDVQTGAQRTSFRARGPVKSMAFTPAGFLVWIAREEGSCPHVAVADLVANEVLWRHVPPFSHADVFALHPAGELLASASDEGLLFYALQTGELIARLPIESYFYPRTMAFGAAGDRLVTASYEEGVLVWDTSWLP